MRDMGCSAKIENYADKMLFNKSVFYPSGTKGSRGL